MAASTVRTETQVNTQANQPVSNRRIVGIQAPVDGQPEKLHLDGVWRIRLTGPGAWSYTNTELRDFLIKNKLVRRLEDWNDAVFYQPGHPGEKYVALRLALTRLLVTVSNWKSSSTIPTQLKKEKLGSKIQRSRIIGAL